MDIIHIELLEKRQHIRMSYNTHGSLISVLAYKLSCFFVMVCLECPVAPKLFLQVTLSWSCNGLVFTTISYVDTSRLNGRWN